MLKFKKIIQITNQITKKAYKVLRKFLQSKLNLKHNHSLKKQIIQIKPKLCIKKTYKKGKRKSKIYHC